MKKSLRVVLLSFLNLACLPFVLSAGFEMKINEETSAQFGFKAQDWVQFAEDAAPDGKGDGLDFSIKTLRFYISGQVHRLAKFGANVDWQRGIWDGGTAVNSTAVLRDANILFDFTAASKIMLGLYRTPFSRVALQDSFGYLLPHSPDTAGAGYIGDTLDYRNLGLAFTGDIPSRKLRYSAGAFEGDLNPAGATAGDDSPFYSARISFYPFEFEKGYVNQGTYLGKYNNLLSLGAGYLSGKYMTGALSPSYNAWTADIFIERKIYNGTLTGEAAFFNYDRDVADGGTSAWYALCGYLFPEINLQPVLRYEKSDRAGLVTGGEDFQKWAFGFNWYLKGHDSKIQVEYARKDYETEGISPRADKDYGDLTAAFQIQF